MEPPAFAGWEPGQHANRLSSSVFDVAPGWASVRGGWYEWNCVGLTAVLAEKPSVARDLAAHLGATRRGEGYLHGEGVVVTWAIGHLVGLAQPHEINPAWKAWRRDLLPMLPEEFPLVVQEETAAQFAVVRRILTSAKVSQVI